MSGESCYYWKPLTGLWPLEIGPSSGHSKSLGEIEYTSYWIMPVFMCFITHLSLKCEIRTEIWKRKEVKTSARPGTIPAKQTARSLDYIIVHPTWPCFGQPVYRTNKRCVISINIRLFPPNAGQVTCFWQWLQNAMQKVLYKLVIIYNTALLILLKTQRMSTWIRP